MAVPCVCSGLSFGGVVIPPNHSGAHWAHKDGSSSTTSSGATQQQSHKHRGLQHLDFLASRGVWSSASSPAHSGRHVFVHHLAGLERPQQYALGCNIPLVAAKNRMCIPSVACSVSANVNCNACGKPEYVLAFRWSHVDGSYTSLQSSSFIVAPLNFPNFFRASAESMGTAVAIITFKYCESFL